MRKSKTTIYENWSTADLFNYLIFQDVFPEDEDFEDWKNLRTELLQKCKEIEG